MEKSCTNSSTPDSSIEFTEITNAVFELELLREKILDYAIHQNKKPIIDNICSYRFVNKSWLQSTNKILLKCQEPLFKFILSRGDSVTDTRRVSHFQSFIDQYSDRHQNLVDSVPPHVIQLRSDFINQDNSLILAKYFANCAGSLIKLLLTFAGEKRITFPKITAPLSRLKVLFVSWYGVRPGASSDDKFNFLQSVLDSTEQLDSISFQCVSYTFNNRMLICPTNFIFPLPVTKLDLVCELNDQHLGTLVKNSLPNLKTLKLVIHYRAFSDGILASVLKNVQSTLKELYFRVINFEIIEENKPSITFQLPLMKNLEKLEMTSKHLELEEQCSSLQRFVPMLTHMALNRQTVVMLQKWAANSCFHSVTSLQVSLARLNDYRDELDIQLFPFDHLQDFDLVSLEILKLAYPNLEELDITLYGAKMTAAIGFIMTEMKKLRRLCIQVFVPDDDYENVEFDIWDEILSGIPQETLEALTQSPDLWESFDVEKNPSIRNLTELHTLELSSIGNYQYSLILEKAFPFAFFKMPTLTKIVLDSCFYTTKEMANKWREDGRIIDASFCC